MASPSVYTAGHGGKVWYQVEGAGTLLSLPNARVTFEVDPRVAEVTESDVTGTRGVKTNAGHPRWEVMVHKRSAGYLEALGLVEGVVLSNLYLQQGNGAICDKIELTTITGRRWEKDEKNETVGVTITGEYGDVTRAVAAPA